MAHNICECLATLMIFFARMMRYMKRLIIMIMFMVCDFGQESDLSGRIKYGDTIY